MMELFSKITECARTHYKAGALFCVGWVVIHFVMLVAAAIFGASVVEFFHLLERQP